MAFDSFMTDIISIYDKEKRIKRGDYKCSFQREIHINKIIDDIEIGDIIERVISGKKTEEYIIVDIGYITKTRFESTKIYYERNEIRKKDENENTKIVIQNSIIQASNFGGSNNKIEVNFNINNEIDKFLKLIENKNIDNKEEIKALLREFETTKNKDKLVNIFSILGNGASIGSMIIALSSLIK